MQTSFGYPSALGYEGEIVSENSRVKDAPALENIPFGRVIGYVGTTKNGYQLPSANKFVFDADLVTSNTIDLTVTIKTISNGEEVSTESDMAQVTYASSHANTIDLICAAIEALDSNLTATDDASDTDNRTIYVTHASNAVVIISDVTVAAGGSQAGVDYAFYGTLEGLAVKAPLEYNSDNTVYFKPNQMVGAMTQGIMTANCIDSTNLGSTLYAQFITATDEPRGSIRTSTDSGVAQVFSALSCALGASSGSLGNFEINRP